MMKGQDTEDASEDTSKLAEPRNGKTPNEAGHDNAGFEEEDRTAMNDNPPVVDNKNGVELVNMNAAPGKTNGSDFTHFYMPVNTHKKLLRGEKLYVTRDPRARGVSRRKVLVCAIVWFLIVVVFVLAVLAAMGILFTSPSSDDSSTEVNKSTFLTVGTDIPTVVANPEDSTSTDVASPQTMQLKFTITNLLFDNNLRDDKSLHFQSLQRRLENELYRVFLPLNIWKVAVTKFSEGSVIVFGLLYWSPDEQAQITGHEISDHFVEVLQQSNTFLGPYSVLLSSVSIMDVTESPDVEISKETRPSEFGRGMSGDWSTGTPMTTTDLWSILFSRTTEKITTHKEEEPIFSTLHLHQFETETETTTVAHETETVSTSVHETEGTSTSLHETETTTTSPHEMETTTTSPHEMETSTTSLHEMETTTSHETTEHTYKIWEPTVYIDHTTESDTPEANDTTHTDKIGLETTVSTEVPFVSNTTESHFYFGTDFVATTTESPSFPETASTVLHENLTDGHVGVSNFTTEFVIPPFFSTQDVQNSTNQTDRSTDHVFPSVTFQEETNHTDGGFVSPFFTVHDIGNTTNETDSGFVSPFITVHDLRNTTNQTESSTEFFIPPFVTMEEFPNGTSNDTINLNETSTTLTNIPTHEDNATDFLYTKLTDETMIGNATATGTHLELNLTSLSPNSTDFYDNVTLARTFFMDTANTTENMTSDKPAIEGIASFNDSTTPTESTTNATITDFQEGFNQTDVYIQSEASKGVSSITNLTETSSVTNVETTTTNVPETSSVTNVETTTTNVPETSSIPTTETTTANVQESSSVTSVETTTATQPETTTVTNVETTTINVQETSSLANIETTTINVQETSSVTNIETTTADVPQTSSVTNTETRAVHASETSASGNETIPDLTHQNLSTLGESSKTVANSTQSITEVENTTKTITNTTTPSSGEVDYANKNEDQEPSTITNNTNVESTTFKEIIPTTQNSTGEVDYTNKKNPDEIKFQKNEVSDNEKVKETKKMENNESGDETTTIQNTEKPVETSTTQNTEKPVETSTQNNVKIEENSSTSALHNEILTTESVINDNTSTTVEDGAGEVTYSSNEKRRRR